MLPRDHGAAAEQDTDGQHCVQDKVICTQLVRKGCGIALVTHTISSDPQCKGSQNSEGLSHKLTLGMAANACGS